jgi:hypothetical protein
MTLKMNQEGEKPVVMEAPTYMVTPSFAEISSGSTGKGIQKKHVLIGGGVIILSGLIISGILGGMYIFANAQKEIIKFSMESNNADGIVKQDVESDPNDNVVKYHIILNGKDVDVVNDFNRDLEVVKMETALGTNCYVSALNRSAALDPSQITGPEAILTHNNSATTVYTTSSTPISDRSFLTKKALDMCKDTGVYWAYRSCISQFTDDTAKTGRQRRSSCQKKCGWKVCSNTCRVTYAGNCKFYLRC